MIKSCLEWAHHINRYTVTARIGYLHLFPWHRLEVEPYMTKHYCCFVLLSVRLVLSIDPSDDKLCNVILLTYY